MIKHISKKLALVLAMSLLMISFASMLTVNAESTADMEKANVKWDLQNGKTLKFKTKYAALGETTQKVKMTNYSINETDEEGYLECTFKLTYTLSIDPSKKQVYKMATAYEKFGTFGDCYYTIVDYETGRCLEEENDLDVTVTHSDWNYTKWKKYKGTGSSWITIARKATITVTVTYPETYKNLAIGVGGKTSYKYDADEFWEGNKVFSKTKLYSKKDKKYAHFMRVE